MDYPCPLMPGRQLAVIRDSQVARLVILIGLIVSCTAPRARPMSGAASSTVSPVPRPGSAAPAPDAPVSRRTGTPSAQSNAGSPPIVFLDPGHGGEDTGTIGLTEDGMVVEEKTVALALALRTAGRLRAAGIGVVLSRTDDRLPGAQPSDYTADGTTLTADGVLADLQRRIDRANASGARVLLSIHLNAYDDPSVRGTETFYDPSRPFASESYRFARLVQTSVVQALRQNGYDTPDRGVSDDTDLIADRLGALDPSYHHLVLLGPGVPGQLRPSTMPGALNEVFFLTNPAEATAAATTDMQDLIAAAYAQAIEQFLRGARSP
ncbi:MAG TPA: N-acetylmuramoyl-L-alanine amidase [Chloroflexota bacterium]|nr:N-acetylmuramoyl-L-alanine amidase [Chloroflexota bacterium]